MDLLRDFIEAFVFFLAFVAYAAILVGGAALIVSTGQWGWLLLYVPFMAAVGVTAIGL